MSPNTTEQVCRQSSNGLPGIRSTVCRIVPLSKQMTAITETPGTSDTSDAPVPDFEIELLDQHGIEGIHIYFK